MAFPAGLQLITVTGQVAGLPDGVPASVTFRWGWLQGPTADAVLAAGHLVVECDTDGEFSVQLPATNDPAWSPVGQTWSVTIVRGTQVTRGVIDLPYDAAGATVDLADRFNPDGETEPGVTYALSSHTHGGGGGPIAISDVTGLTAALAGKLPTAGGTVTGPLVVNGVLEIGTSLTLEIGDDTNLYRVSANRLATDDSLDVGGDLLVYGNVDLQGAIAGIAIADVAGLTAALDGRASDAELAALDDRVADLEAAPGGGSTLVVKRATVTSGNLTLAVSVPWVAVAGGPSLVLAAAVGDYVEFEAVSMLGNFGVNFLDMAVVAGGSLVRYLSTGTATPATEGAPPFYGDQSFDRFGPVFEFVVEAGDLDGGNVTVVFATKGSGGGTIYASADYPLRWRALNHGPATVS